MAPDTTDERCHQDRTSSQTSPRTEALSRRSILTTSAVVMASAVGVRTTDTVTANGKGGQAFVPKDAHESGREFEIKTSASSCRDDPGQCEVFGCNKNQQLPFPERKFQYIGEDTQHTFYTRDNTLDQSQTYRWKKHSSCPELYSTAPEPVIQANFSPVK